MSEVRTICPDGFFCPARGMDIYLKCANGTYCDEGSVRETDCPAGTFGTSNPRNYEEPESCKACDPGFYSSVGLNRCVVCPGGYVCLGGTTTANPTTEEENGYICPAGFYCPSGALEPIACPLGTFNPDIGQESPNSCQLCPAN